MKKILLTFTATLLFTGCVPDSNLTNPEEQKLRKTETAESLKLGFCSTMQSDAQNFQTQNQNIELVTFGSAREVLVDLKMGKIDLALIGRKAKKSEIGENILEKKLFEKGFTLIAPQKSFIAENEMAQLEARTCLDEELIKDKFSELENIAFVEKSNCKINNQGVWLIDWHDWNDDMELLIPVDRWGNKIKKYRSAFLYGEELGFEP